MNQHRLRRLNSQDFSNGPVIYWMNRDMRLHDNWALIYAKEQAEERKVPLIIVYNLVPNYLGGGLRQWHFKIHALKELSAECAKFNIPLYILVDNTAKNSGKAIVEISQSISAGLIVTDFCPLRSSRAWAEDVRKKAKCAVVGVDAHNIVPVWIASPKQEFGAYTLRPKLHKLMPEYLEEFPPLTKQMKDQSKKAEEYMKNISFQQDDISFHDSTGINWNTLLNDPKIPKIPTIAKWCVPGEKAAKKELQRFLDEKMHRYAQFRNDPSEDAQSNLSPYLHYGNISAQRIALDALKHEGKSVNEALYEKKNGSKEGCGIEAFLEELIVRRELSDNYCFYNPNYDNFEGAPDWAKETLRKSREDKREFTYSKKQFEEAKTHDELWNAAQLEMVKRGKMSGYMRMYWAKKILEWTTSPEEAIKTAIYLNDKYELDGREANGYVGIMWSIAGLHDRAWFSRPIFGAIRYMARSGCEKKFDVKRYITKWSS